MKAAGILLAAAVLGFTPALRADDDFLDPVDEDLAVSADHDDLRARLSGTLDLEAYGFQQPAPGLIISSGTGLFVPRLSLYLDAQLGPFLYAFAAFRADRGFDPSDGSLRGRMDEYGPGSQGGTRVSLTVPLARR